MHLSFFLILIIMTDANINYIFDLASDSIHDLNFHNYFLSTVIIS